MTAKPFAVALGIVAMIRILPIAVASILLAAPAHAAVITFVGGNDFRVVSVSDVDVAGTLYDVTFSTNVSFADFKAANPTTYLPFDNTTDASAANDALRDAINAALVDASSGGGGANRTFNIFVTYAETLTNFSVDSIFDQGGLNPLTYASGYNGPLDLDYPMNLASTPQAFTVWTVSAVPEPATLLLVGAGLIAAGANRRYRKARA